MLEQISQERFEIGRVWVSVVVDFCDVKIQTESLQKWACRVLFRYVTIRFIFAFHSRFNLARVSMYRVFFCESFRLHFFSHTLYTVYAHNTRFQLSVTSYKYIYVVYAFIRRGGGTDYKQIDGGSETPSGTRPDAYVYTHIYYNIK